MNLDQFTERSRGFIQAAQTIAQREDHARLGGKPQGFEARWLAGWFAGWLDISPALWLPESWLAGWLAGWLASLVAGLRAS